MRHHILVSLTILGLAGCESPDPVCPTIDMEVLPFLELEPVGTGWSYPVFLTQAPGDDALYVLEKAGVIVRVDPDGTQTEFARIVDQPDGVAGGGEQGLLGLAFHPGFASNGRYFVFYTPAVNTSNRVEEWTGSGASAAPVRRLIDLPDPEGNHNGGMLAFGRDGYLYASIGDGGGAGDAHGTIGNGLDLTSGFGKIHRFDVDNEANGFAAAGNPFSAPNLPTIWAYGLRNPWRFSFDRLTGDMWIGDVGQGQWEEVNFQPASSRGGENYGWRANEGLEPFDLSIADQAANAVEPIHVYPHDGRCSITGGYVYRGSAIPELYGWYLFADYCAGEVRALRRCEGTAAGERRAMASVGNILSFGEDRDGELYVMSPFSLGRIVRSPE